ncbi:hypothetical protein Q3G72_015840 [Acer saccharum]|nr:hypothetical protein Q3G72_015840 [Acer saccharum]
MCKPRLSVKAISRESNMAADFLANQADGAAFVFDFCGGSIVMAEITRKDYEFWARGAAIFVVCVCCCAFAVWCACVVAVVVIVSCFFPVLCLSFGWLFSVLCGVWLWSGIAWGCWGVLVWGSLLPSLFFPFVFSSVSFGVAVWFDLFVVLLGQLSADE